MVKRNSGAEVIYDTPSGLPRGAGSRSYANEWRNFMSSNLGAMYQKAPAKEVPANKEFEEEIDMKKTIREIEFIGSSSKSWKERKAVENRKAVLLGGKPQKKQRLPLSVAKVPMKRQKLREEKQLQEDIILGRFRRKKENKPGERRRTEGDLLRPSNGIFKKGVLNVKHLLNGPAQPKPAENFKPTSGGRRKGKGNNKGKKRGKKH